jgi:hypothetical protein
MMATRRTSPSWLGHARPALAATAAAVLFVLAGCSSDGDDAGASSADSASREVAAEPADAGGAAEAESGVGGRRGG